MSHVDNLIDGSAPMSAPGAAPNGAAEDSPRRRRPRRPTCVDGRLTRQQYLGGVAWLLDQALITSEEAGVWVDHVPSSRTDRCRAIDFLEQRAKRGQAGRVTGQHQQPRPSHLITHFSATPKTIEVDRGEATRIEFNTVPDVVDSSAYLVKYESTSEATDSRWFSFKRRPAGHLIAVWDGTFDGSRNRPPEPGVYRVRVFAKDAAGNAEERFTQIVVRNEAGSTVLPRTESGLAAAAFHFDGRRVVFSDEGGNTIIGRAVSGLRANNPRNTERRDFTDPRFQSAKDRGPIPAGTYFIDANTTQAPDLTVRGLRYPSGGSGERWGPFRAPLRPATPGQTLGRSGFFFHLDVHNDGTAGCIGVQTADESKFNQMAALLLRVQPGKPVRVVVDYGK